MQSDYKKLKKRCFGKIRYSHFCDGVKAADQYNQSMALVWYPMTVYWCNPHQAYHKGHNRFLPITEQISFLEASRKRAQQ